jgi:hypothetical protein
MSVPYDRLQFTMLEGGGRRAKMKCDYIINYSARSINHFFFLSKLEDKDK